MTDLSFSVVIPVWNLPDDLRELLKALSDLRIFTEIIVSDDGSTENCDPFSLGFSSETLGAELKYVRSDEQRGAGHARNLGLAAVTSEHVLFLDADDRPLPGLRQIWERHLVAIEDGLNPDFTIFRHIDSRVMKETQKAGTFVKEEGIWDSVLQGRPEASLDLRERATLCGISAYPWNKIYRTEFLRENGILCSETPVHNDVKLHWLSFLKAQNVLALHRPGIVHIVAGSAHHLTNRSDENRFCLFGILDDVKDHIRENGSEALFLRQFLHFAHAVLHWGHRVIAPRLQPVFRERMRKWYLGLTSAEFTIYALWEPRKANQIAEFLTTGDLV